MRKTKYIVVRDGFHMFAILFPDDLIHSQIVPRGFQVHSAGFVEIDFAAGEGYTIRCYGRSTSLGVEPDPEQDAFFIRRALGLY